MRAQRALLLNGNELEAEASQFFAAGGEWESIGAQWQATSGMLPSRLRRDARDSAQAVEVDVRPERIAQAQKKLPVRRMFASCHNGFATA